MSELRKRIADLPPEQREELLNRLTGKRNPGVPPETMLEWSPVRVAPLTLAQQRLWFMSRIEPDTPAYNVRVSVRLLGELSVQALRQALAGVGDRQESLRIRFETIAGLPRQVVTDARLQLAVIDLSNLPESLAATETGRIKRIQAQRPFDLSCAPLVRTILLSRRIDDHSLVLILHHLICDGWSIQLLLHELTALYASAERKQPHGLRPIPFQVVDIAEWQQRRLEQQDFAEGIAYWRQRLADPPADLLLGRRIHSGPRSNRSVTESRLLSPQLSRSLRQYSAERAVTHFTVLLAVFKVLLSRYTASVDLMVGCSVANRDTPELEPVIGFFLNMLMMRSDLSGDPSFASLVQRVRQTVLEAFDHADTPFELVVRSLQPERDNTRTPLIQIAFDYQRTPRLPTAQSGLCSKVEGFESRVATFDVTMFALETDERLVLTLECREQIFERRAVARMLGHFENLLAGALQDDSIRLSRLAMLDQSELRQVTQEWNFTSRPYPEDATLHSVFERVTERQPDTIAAVYGAEHVTYSLLNRYAAEFARRLRRHGAGPNAPVVLCVPRSPAMLIGKLGILKAGSAYVPLDPEDPTARLKLVIEDVRATIVATSIALRDRFVISGVRSVCIDETEESSTQNSTGPDHSVFPDNVAYVMYTSGSTGIPKGVAVTHRAILPLVFNTNYVDFSRGRRIAQIAHCSFDAATFEFWGTLLHGGRLVGIEKHLGLDPKELAQTLRRHDIDLLFLTATLFNEVIREDPSAFRGVGDLLVGGEICDVAMIRRCLSGEPPARLLNGYGPTEAVTFSTWYEAAAMSPDMSSFPIGRPLSNSRVYLLDPALEPVPIGVEAEIFIGGESLALGYTGRPDLTAERFLPDPFSESLGARMYRSGDLGVFGEDGTIEFRGRCDRQIKLRGFRIELNEVEQALRRHPSVADAAVVALGSPRTERIEAFLVVQKDLPVTTAQLREWLSERLPSYMIPMKFRFFDSFPRTSSGKLHLAALMESTGSISASSDDGKPRTAVEEVVEGVWTGELGIESVSRYTSFFEAGGHSLMALRIVSSLRHAFRIQLSLRDLFDFPTIEKLASRIQLLRRSSNWQEPPPLARITRDGDLELSFAQQRLWFAHQIAPDESIYNSAAVLRLEGDRRPQLGPLKAALEFIEYRHEPLRTVFSERNAHPVQNILPPAGLHLAVIDLAGLREDLVEAEATRISILHAAAPFDLERGPILRVALILATERETRLLLAVHHIAFDAGSLDVFVRELAASYDQFAQGRRPELTELPIRYSDFSTWQRRWFQGTALDQRLQYWTERLRDVPQTAILRTDYSYPPSESFRGAAEPFPLGEGLNLKIWNACQRHGVTPFMVLLAGYLALLYRHSGGVEIIGTDVTGRDMPATQGLIGFFVNILPLRVDVAGNPSFADLLAHVRTTALDAYEFQDTPFEKIVEAVSTTRPRDRQPLVQVLLSYRDQSLLPNASWTLTPTEFTSTARWDLALVVTKQPKGEFAGTFLYKTSLFRAETIRLLGMSYSRLLAAALDDSAIHLSDLPLERELERREVMKPQQRPAGIPLLADVSPQSVDLSQMQLVRIEHPDVSSGLLCVIRPELDDVDIVDWTGSHTDELEQLLCRWGAILFDGFHIDSSAEFQRMAETLCADLCGEYGDLPRETISDKIYSVTPYPPEQRILFHNEGVHTGRWPSRIFFCCQLPAESGGETPIADCRAIAREIEPAILERFEREGCCYVRNFMFDRAYLSGLDVSWSEFFRTNDRDEVERVCRGRGVDFEWGPDAALRISKHSAVVRRHPRTGERVFASQLLTHHVSCLDDTTRRSVLSLFDERHLPRNVYYGGGGTIEDSVIHAIRQSYERHSASVPWKKGNVMMLDNMLVAHSRSPYTGPRKVVVALGDMAGDKD